jgi:hypothetical protein
MITGDFYLSLPSNGSSKSFPNNKQSNFTTLLENPIELLGRYQVALVEISNFSNFSVNLGSIIFKNPFFGSVYENRTEFIEFEIRIDNGVDLSQFCSKLNYEIQNNFIKTEFLFRQKLAFSTDTDFIQEMQFINDNKKDFKRPLLNVLKSEPDYYEVIDKNDSIFMKLFSNAGGTYSFEKSRFIFKNIDILKKLFLLIIIRIPSEKDQTGIGNYFIDKAVYIKSDDYLLESESQERSWPQNENLLFNVQNLSLIHQKNQSSLPFFNRDFDLSEYFFFCPYFKQLNSTAVKLVTNSEIRFKGLISQLLNNSEISNTILTKDNIFILNSYLQLTKFILVYCDIIEPQLYADNSSPILRTVNIKSQKNENVIFFDNPQYLNINRSRFNTINIELKDTQNNYIEFNDKFSNIFISLHFKNKR